MIWMNIFDLREDVGTKQIVSGSANYKARLWFRKYSETCIHRKLLGNIQVIRCLIFKASAYLEKVLPSNEKSVNPYCQMGLGIPRDFQDHARKMPGNSAKYHVHRTRKMSASVQSTDVLRLTAFSAAEG